MFKGTSERGSFRRRVASHSTKGFANGRIEVLPAAAKPKEEVYSDLQDQYDLARAQLPGLLHELRETGEQLKKTMGFSKFKSLSERRDALISATQSLQSTIGKQKLLLAAVADSDFCRVFYRIAEAKLSKELFIEIDQATIGLVGRKRI